tara:strand:+ start:270 stop:536 length:267 start_codon:yes stop_codon:yes gene_type:complete
VVEAAVLFLKPMGLHPEQVYLEVLVVEVVEEIMMVLEQEQVDQELVVKEMLEVLQHQIHLVIQILEVVEVELLQQVEMDRLLQVELVE